MLVGGCRASKNPLVLKKKNPGSRIKHCIAAASRVLEGASQKQHRAISRVLVLIASLLLAKTHTRYCQHDLQAVLVLPLFCSVLSDHPGNQTPDLLRNMTGLVWHPVGMGAGSSLMGPLLCQCDSSWGRAGPKRDAKSWRIISVMQCPLLSFLTPLS